MNKVIKHIPEMCLAAVLIAAIICNNYAGIFAGTILWLFYMAVVRLLEEVEKL